MPPKNQPVTAAEVQHLEQAMGSFTLKDDLILRVMLTIAGVGTAGTKIPVEANMYQARFTKSAATVFHYDVEINPVAKVANQKMPKPLAAKIFKAAQQVAQQDPDAMAFRFAAFDQQKNAYTTTKFAVDKAGKRTVRVELPEPGREMSDKRRFNVVFQLANTIDLQSIIRFCSGDKQSTQEGNIVTTAMQAISVMLRQEPSQRYTALGARNRYYSLNNATELPNGALVLSGFHQAFRATSNKLPAIQIDTAYTAVWKSGLLSNNVGQYLGVGGGGGGGRGGRGGFRGGRGGGRGGAPQASGHGVQLDNLQPNQIRVLKKLLYGAKFTLPYKKNDRVYTLKNISNLPASDIRFVVQGQDGAPDKQVGLVQYYKQNHGINLTKPRLPCVVYGKNFMAPFELVHICDFNPVPFAAMTSDQTAAMIQVAAARPMQRAQSIKQWRAALAYQNSPLLEAWGLQVQANMMRIDARVLPPPKINYKGGKSTGLWNGGWNLKPNNGPAMTFTRPGNPLKSWAILCGAPRMDIQACARFQQQLVKALQSYGCAVANTNPDLIQLARVEPNSRNSDLHDSLALAARTCYQKNKMNPQLIVVILPFKDTAIYKEVKTIGAMSRANLQPVVTQCLVADKLMNERGLDQYLGNVAMKIHAKVGGVTHEVSVPGVDATTMVIGADVTHPSGGLGKLNPSIAVSVGALNPANVTFQTEVRLQDPRQEVISDLGEMTKLQLETYMNNNKGVPPAKILFFRDGVSDGQWQIVKDREVAAIRKTAAELKQGYKPKITFVICAKRHNMRFFGIEGVTKQMDAKNGNLPPGTVVDTMVTHPFVFDFYLQAHHGLQGAARPTHYVVVVDDNNFTADQMQEMCYKMSSTYQRATRSVSTDAYPRTLPSRPVSRRTRTTVGRTPLLPSPATLGRPRSRSRCTSRPLPNATAMLAVSPHM
ncbi:Protein argonaute [Vanrija albida]|uniref:Protein argonaute n=1 Tax=Vanrija albida TaxID=181172 RepID=A0ABR3QAH4_9TREE